MKKYSIAFLVLWSTVTCFAFNITAYKNKALLDTVVVSQPTLVEIKNLNQEREYVITDDTNIPIEQQSMVIRKSVVIEPIQVEACTLTCVSGKALADGDIDTTFDFPIRGVGLERGRIVIVYAKPLTTDSIVFRTTRDSYAPTVFTLTVDGKPVLNTISGGSARFPKMEAQKIEIEFAYNQPIRFTEVGVGTLTEEEITSTARFVYMPGKTYQIYLDSVVGKESTPIPSINLFAKNDVKEIVFTGKTINTVYKDRDADADGIIDSVDNCLYQQNADQKDSNGNGTGDVCDDYDYDGVATYLDNCPTESNANQNDVDKDGKGDICDQEESRITEKYVWLPWVVFFGVLLAVLGMGYEVIKGKKLGSTE